MFGEFLIRRFGIDLRLKNRVLNIALGTFCVNTVYKEFVRCLTCLPGLHTLQLLSFPGITSRSGSNFPSAIQMRECRDSLQEAFVGIRLDNIVTLTLPAAILDNIVRGGILTAFPHLQHLALFGNPFFTQYCLTDSLLSSLPLTLHSLTVDRSYSTPDLHCAYLQQCTEFS